MLVFNRTGLPLWYYVTKQDSCCCSFCGYEKVLFVLWPLIPTLFLMKGSFYYCGELSLPRQLMQCSPRLHVSPTIVMPGGPAVDSNATTPAEERRHRGPPKRIRKARRGNGTGEAELAPAPGTPEVDLLALTTCSGLGRYCRAIFQFNE